MSNVMYFDSVVSLGGTLEYPSTRGRFNVNHLVSLSRQLLSTDPVGTTTITLTNVSEGSNISIETQDGTTVRYQQQYGTAMTLYDATTLYDAATLYDAQNNVAIPLDVYQAGSALNALRIKIRKGSASPYYLPYETQVTATTTPISIYVSQIPDE